MEKRYMLPWHRRSWMPYSLSDQLFKFLSPRPPAPSNLIPDNFLPAYNMSLIFNSLQRPYWSRMILRRATFSFRERGSGKYSLHLKVEPIWVRSGKKEKKPKQTTKANENTEEESPFKFTFKENHGPVYNNCRERLTTHAGNSIAENITHNLPV